jgi:hypothetical protein
MRTLLTIFLLCLATQAGAQVYKCKDASGKTLFSDLPCQGQYKGKNVQKGRDSVSANERQQAAAIHASQAQWLMSRGNRAASGATLRSIGTQGGYWTCK